MARAPWSGDEIYEAAALFKDRCLARDGALFSDAEVWGIDGLRQIERQLGQSSGGGSYVDRLIAQVEDLPQAEIQLAAEILYVLLLPQADTHATTKRAHVSRLLAVLETQPELPSVVDGALDANGVANFSTAKAWSAKLLQLIARVALRLKELPASDLERALSEPVAFRDIVSELQTSTDRMMAYALQHLLFPDRFEYVISEDHRNRLVEAFEGVPEVAELEDVDAKISRIRELASRGITWVVDVYDEPFRQTWSEPASPQWRDAIKWSRLLFGRDDFDATERDYKVEIAAQLVRSREAMLAGDASWPELMRKAYRGRRYSLIDWRVGDPFLDWLESDLPRGVELLRRLWDTSEVDGNVIRAFLDGLPKQAVSGSGTRASVTSWLQLAVDRYRFPFYKPTVHEGLRRALGLPRLRGLDVHADTVYRPDDLAARLGLDGPRVRQFLREKFPREHADRGTSWYLTADQAQAVVDQFEDETNVQAPDARLADWQSLLEQLRLRMLAANSPIRDALDAQGIAWWLVSGRPPEDWDESMKQAFASFGKGGGARTAETPEGGDDPAPNWSHLLPPVDEPLAVALHLPQSFLAELMVMLEDKRQLILYGPPGTGKTYIAQRLGKHIEAHGGQYRLVQFHPSYTYEDFFEGYRPKRQDDGALSFELVPGTLRELSREAAENPSRPHLLIIDELNRGNIAKIFGELYFLLEYRDESMRLQYSRDEQFSLPSNLFVIATMNTADRSIALVDSALRRRFYFVGLMPTQPPVDRVLDSWLEQHHHEPEPAVLLRYLNAAIAEREYSIGPSYFMTRDGSFPQLERIWANAIMPLLEEHYYGSNRDLEAEFGLAALRKRVAAKADETAAEGDDDDGA